MNYLITTIISIDHHFQLSFDTVVKFDTAVGNGRKCG